MKAYQNFDEYVEDFSRFSDRLALTTRPFIKIEKLTYGQLQANAYKTAHYLQGLGLKAGQRIMVIGPNSPQWVELFLGAQLAGIIVVPVDAQSSIDTVRGFAERTGPKRIFKSKYLLTGLEKHFSCLPLEELDLSISGEKAVKVNEKLDKQPIALVVFTSGTTADPKGVELSQQNILSNVYGVQQALTIDPDWRLLSVLPLSHMYELTGGCLAPLVGGASIYYLPRVTPLAIVRALREYKITTILAVPQLLVQFLERIRQGADEQGKRRSFERALRVAQFLPMTVRRMLFRSVHKNLGGHLGMVVTGGAPIPRDTAVAWERIGVKLVQGYGLTETSPILSVNDPSDRRLDSQGRPIGNVELRVDPGNQEIQAKGPNVFKAYWHDSKKTRAAFTDDGWFRTGDIGELKGGLLYIRGRSKFVIVLSSGLNVVPEDIESVAENYPELGSLCIVGVTTPEGAMVHAVVISKLSDQKIDFTIAEINAHLESFQHIDGWTRWPEKDFPRTRLLKIDRRHVQDWINARSDDEKQDITPAGKSSSDSDQLARIVRLALGQSNVRIKETDRLSDAGVDSLRRLAIVSLVEEQLGVTINESDITQVTTLEGLRKIVKSGSPVRPPAAQASWTFNPLVRFLGNAARDTIVSAILSIWVNQRTEGGENLDRIRGPALYIFNHVDDFDAPVIFKALPKKVRRKVAIASADDVMREHTVLAFIARFCFASYNFARVEPIMPSMEYTATLVNKGWGIVLAPEGKIHNDYRLHEFKSGIGLLAIELGLPVVPIKTFGLVGTVPLHSKWPKKHSRVIVRIGQPVHFTDRGYDEATRSLYDAMVKL